MSRRILSWFLLLAFITGLVGSAQAQAPEVGDPVALVAVEISAPGDLERFEATGLPAYARLQGLQPQDYLLAGADRAGQALLSRAGLSYRILDADLRGARSARYYLAYAMPGRQITWGDYGQVLLDDGVQVLLRADTAQAEALSLAGAELRQVTFDPKPLRAAAAPLVAPEDVIPDPLIQSMIDQVDSSTVYSYTGGLSGEWPVDIGGSPYTILTRNTYSGEPIQKATQWTGEHFANLELNVEYHVWGGETYPNVIGELAGLINPEDIFIIGGHLDDRPVGPIAPGADDNASGSVAAMIAADILTQFEWGCTLRFALWTGEEEGLNGSHAYAQRSFNAGENIVGYLNLDMIAWNTPDSSPDIDLAADSSLPETLVLAQLFADVVEAYNLNLIPEIDPDGTGASDHASFWDYGYTAILGIEDFGDFNPRYHTTGDQLQYLDMAYYTEFVKAAIGTFAHMSNCLIPSGIGSLDGTVTAQNGGAPIQGALVVADDGAGHTFEKFTDVSGYYTRTLLAGTYDVTALAYGYLPTTVSGVTIVTDTVTTQDFALPDAPYYTVSGTVTEAGSGVPLLAEVVFEGSPVSVWTDPSTGFYSTLLPEGEYTMHVSASLHQPESRPITLTGDRTEDFALNPLPPILLVDDDDNGPDVRATYTAALDALGRTYDVWDTNNTDNEPDASTLNGYELVIWFTGDEYGGFAGPGSAGEDALADFLDAGKCLFLSGQDYHYDRGLTSFMQEYLGAASITDDNGNYSSVSGQGSVFGGLGPYSLSYPFSDYSDPITPNGSAELAFQGNNGNGAAVSKDNGVYKTTFWVFPFEALSSAPYRQEAMLTFLDWCTPYNVALSGNDALTGIPSETLTYTLSVTNTSNSLTDTFSVSLGASLFPAMADADEVGPLLPDESAVFHVLVSIPESALPGEEDLVEVRVTSQGDAGVWDSALLTSSVGGSYGVLLGSEQTEDEGAAGSTLTYTLSLTNSGSLQDTLVLTTTGINPGWQVLLAEDSFDLAGGESVETTFQVTIPGSANQGDWDAFMLQAASSHDPTKWDEVEFTTTVSQECTALSEVGYTWDPVEPWAGDLVTFLGNASGTTPINYAWDFGDGETAAGEQVTHIYTAGGTYAVTLTVSNACSEVVLPGVLSVAPSMQLYLPVISKSP